MEIQPSVNWSHSTQNKPDFGSGEITIHGQMEHMTKSYADTYDDTGFFSAGLVTTQIHQSQDITNIKILKEGMGLHKEIDLFVSPKLDPQFPGYIQSTKVVLGMPALHGWTRFPTGVNIISMKEREQRGRDQLKMAIAGLRESEDEKAAPQAIEYACQLIDRLPSGCFVLPAPDVSATSKEEVYLEWMLEKDGRLLLTVGPDGTVAYVCTFGTARSKNLGAWKDQIVDLMSPCFAKLVQIHQKDLPEWDASKIALP